MQLFGLFGLFLSKIILIILLVLVLFVLKSDNEIASFSRNYLKFIIAQKTIQI